VARSQNAILAKLAVRHLSAQKLQRTAAAFGFARAGTGTRTGSDTGVLASADIPAGDPLEFARAAAGFWHSELSPLGGAAIAATIASGGVAVVPWTPRGHAAPRAPRARRRAISEDTARAVAAMMRATTTRGTARAAFAGFRVPVAGKTGSLSAPGPGRSRRDYSWFVGFAPADAPRYVISVILANDPDWELKAPAAAREVLEVLSY
jgi:penicillin-binding protein A